ncbi:hypothetical protein SeMB42_g00681 [Synchytrium endobioticum]|uniref:RING-type domain-containing protein n=1 Tax=Synchytrium endobioticum TaxID=286115 RepID=A0A507DGT7_9FUNG|nr:hypothetical protein SeLEV6574_g00837 [Synchytrium endobioticum]TPX53587.1 hypothetical protein SeMB42_g00681 [Synchytrium endobioticum]
MLLQVDDETCISIQTQPHNQPERILLLQTSKPPRTSRISKVCTDPRLYQILEESRLTLLQRAVQASDVVSFGADIRDAINKFPTTNRDSDLKLPITLYTTILNHLDALGWERVRSVGAGMRSVALLFSDANRRNHVAQVTFPPTYPNIAPTCTVSLPQPVQLRWDVGRTTLADMLGQCTQAASQYTAYFEHMDDLQDNAWVAPFEAGSNTRVVKLGNHCSLHVTVNPTRVDARPEFHFTGPNNAVLELNNALRMNLNKWNPNMLLRENIQNLLGFQLPARQNTNDVTANGTSDDIDGCSICYSVTLEDNIPDKACGGCGRLFHNACLVEWLRTLPSSRIVAQKLIGPCPICDQEVSTDL